MKKVITRTHIPGGVEPPLVDPKIRKIWMESMITKYLNSFYSITPGLCCAKVYFAKGDTLLKPMSRYAYLYI